MGARQSQTGGSDWSRGLETNGDFSGKPGHPTRQQEGLVPPGMQKEKTEASAPRSWSGRGWKNHQNAKEELGPGGPAGGWKPVNTRGSADVFAATVTIGGARAALVGAAVTEGICLGVDAEGLTSPRIT